MGSFIKFARAGETIYKPTTVRPSPSCCPKKKTKKNKNKTKNIRMVLEPAIHAIILPENNKNLVNDHINCPHPPSLSFPSNDPQHDGFSAKYLTAKYLGSNVNSCFIATSSNQSDTTILGSMFPFFAISSNLGHRAFSGPLGDVNK